MQSFWEEFKKPIVVIASFFVLLFVYTKLAGPFPFYINSVNTTKTDLFSSSGTGEVTAVPDQATVNVGVTKTAQSVKDAQNATNTVANKLISDLKKLGIKESDIKTTNYSVNPNLVPNGTPSGYEVTQNIEVKVKPIELANKVIDTATADGANLVGGVNYTFSDDLQNTLQKEATQMAVSDAKNKAQDLANAAGVKLGKVVNVVSNNNSGPVTFDIAQKSDQQTATPPTNITPGENTVNISVIIYYETY